LTGLADPLPLSSLIAKPMNAVVATISATNGVRGLADLKRTWLLAGGTCVTFGDVVVQKPTATPSTPRA
jgi:hypothetical protein